MNHIMEKILFFLPHKIKDKYEYKDLILSGKLNEKSKINYIYKHIKDMSYLFEETNMEESPWLDLTYVENIEGLFKGCIQLKKIKKYNTSNVINMNYMFKDCKRLTETANLNMLKVKTAKSMYEGCSNLKLLHKFNALEIENMSYMFKDCISIRTIPPLNMLCEVKGMFEGCVNVDEVIVERTGLKIGKNNSDMSYMFKDCKLIKKIPNYEFYGSKSKSVFEGCKKLEELEEIKMYSIEDSEKMFKDCISLEYAPKIEKKNTKYWYINNMFEGCVNLRFLEIYNITEMISCVNIFKGCEKITEFELLKFFKQKKLTEVEKNIFNQMNKKEIEGQIKKEIISIIRKNNSINNKIDINKLLNISD